MRDELRYFSERETGAPLQERMRRLVLQRLERSLDGKIRTLTSKRFISGHEYPDVCPKTATFT